MSRNPEGLKPRTGKQLTSEPKLRPPKEKKPPGKRRLQLKNLRLGTASEGRPYKCAEEKPKAPRAKTARGAPSFSYRRNPWRRRRLRSKGPEREERCRSRR
jgi:hypothetical protein